MSGALTALAGGDAPRAATGVAEGENPIRNPQTGALPSVFDVMAPQPTKICQDANVDDSHRIPENNILACVTANDEVRFLFISAETIDRTELGEHA